MKHSHVCQLFGRCLAFRVAGWLRSAPNAFFGRWNRVCRSTSGLVLLLAGINSGAAAAPPNYEIVQLGLIGSEHTRIGGYQYSLAEQLNEAGQVRGYSERFSASGSSLGFSAWLYDGSTTKNVGLTDSEHTHYSGTQYSESNQLNDAGQVLGFANQYVGGSTVGRSTWLYDGATTNNIGLHGGVHTRSDGYRYADSQQLNEAGQASGISQRYSGFSAKGYSAWLYDGATTTNIGLMDSGHIRSDGYHYSESEQLNEAGQVRGYSDRYLGSSNGGRTAWLYDGTTTHSIGLTGSEYTSGGYQYSYSEQLNEAGQVRGQSARYNGSLATGYSAWLYDGTTTNNIGLTGSEHTRADGYQLSTSLQLNEAGQVRGYSDRYFGSSNAGRSEWLYDGTTTHVIGLTGGDHTRSDGYQYSYSDQLNEAGQVRGRSARYDGSLATGYSAWLYDGTATHNIGLTAGVHTRSDGYQYSLAQQLNEAGQVGGYSARYSGVSDLGTSAWLYDGTTTNNIGLTGSEHTRADGYQLSTSQQLSEAGQVLGRSARYDGSLDTGSSAWLYDGTATLNIGLTGGVHTRSDGYQFSLGEQLNEAGQVRGYSNRYLGGSALLGQDAWVYDPIWGTISLQLSLRDDGYAYSSAEFLADDGLVLGYYNLYSGMSLVGERAFYWSADDGLWDLGLLVDGGLPANGWDWLNQALRANGLGHIGGFGLASSATHGRSEFLLVPVPEPSGLVLASLAAIGLAVSVYRRGQKSPPI